MELQSNSNLVWLYLLFLPLLALVCQSYFRLDLVASPLIQLSGPYWWVYWASRAALLYLFVWMLFFFEKRIVVSKSIQEQAPDRYETLRRSHDPLLGLRAMACFMVLLGHWFLVVFSPAAPTVDSVEYGLRALLSASPWGGVWIFFSLSGYLMGKGFVTGRHTTSLPGIRRFYRNRLLRIAPIYLSAIFIVSMLISPEYINITQKSAAIALMDSLLIDLSSGGAIGALWSVSTEFQFYLLVPFLYLAIKKMLKSTWQYAVFGLTLVAVYALAKYSIVHFGPTRWYSYTYTPFLANIDAFLPGFLTAFIVQDMRNRGLYLRHGLSLGYVSMFILYIAVSLWTYPEMSVFPGMPGSATRIYYLSFAPGLIALATSSVIFLFEVSTRQTHSSHIFWKVQSFLGILTYCLYVWHEPVYLAFRKLFPANLEFFQSLQFMPIGLVLSVAMALLFYVFIEKQFDKKKSKA